MSSGIDLVVAYVDNKDPTWRKTFIDYCIKTNQRVKIGDLHGSRFEDIGLINYQLRLANKNMPWLDNIYLLLSNIEQAPKNLPSNVKVVLHKDFIPRQFLPTFNSTTIEMFLWNIPNLQEHFIYANDDMLPCKPMLPNDFFYRNSIRIKFKNDPLKFNHKNEFPYHCINNVKHVCETLGVKCDETNILRPIHSFTPMIKSHCIECYNALKRYIDKEIWGFRTIYQHNQYIYPLWEKFKYKTYDTKLTFFYSEVEQDKEIDFDNQIVCINLIKCKDKISYIKERLEQLCE